MVEEAVCGLMSLGEEKAKIITPLTVLLLFSTPATIVLATFTLEELWIQALVMYVHLVI